MVDRRTQRILEQLLQDTTLNELADDLCVRPWNIQAALHGDYTFSPEKQNFILDYFALKDTNPAPVNRYGKLAEAFGERKSYREMAKQIGVTPEALRRWGHGEEENAKVAAFLERGKAEEPTPAPATDPLALVEAVLTPEEYQGFLKGNALYQDDDGKWQERLVAYRDARR